MSVWSQSQSSFYYRVSVAVELKLCWYFLISRCDSNFIESDKFAHSPVLVYKDAFTYITTFFALITYTTDKQQWKWGEREQGWHVGRMWAGIKLGCCRTDKNNHTLASSSTFAVTGCRVWQNIDIEFGIFTSNVFKSPFLCCSDSTLTRFMMRVCVRNMFTCKKKSWSSESLDQNWHS